MVLPVVTVSFAAICIWLIVRYVNRREKWAKWTLAAVIAVPVLYVASIGPVCHLTLHPGQDLLGAPQIYFPLGWVVSKSDRAETAVRWYLGLVIPDRVFGVTVPFNSSGERWLIGPLH